MACRVVLRGGLLAMLAMGAGLAQAPVKAVPPMPADEAAYKKALAIGEPAPQLSAILRFITDYPNSRSVPMMIGRAYTAAEQAGSLNSAKATEMALDIARRVAKASPMARSEAAKALAQRLLAKNLAAEAESYARAATKELNEEDHVARERSWYQQKVEYFTARDPKYKALPFYVDEAREKYRAAAAGTWSTLARALMKQGRDADARQALGKSLAITRTADAASGYAELAAKEGDTHTVLDALGTAILTGKATKDMTERFRAAYAEAKMPMNAEVWLDRRFRSESRNPLQPTAYNGPAATPRRSVLMEMVTGAGCEPCISVDLAADALLNRYSRQDLILLAYHIHAPVTDPLVSGAAEAREKFYGARGAPTVYLDGEEVEPGEGTGAVAKPVFDELDAAVREAARGGGGGGDRCEGAVERFRVEGQRGGERSRGSGIEAGTFLVEKEVSYSGENGFRLHPMVVRSSKELDGLRGEWTVDVGGLASGIAKYMDGTSMG